MIAPHLDNIHGVSTQESGTGQMNQLLANVIADAGLMPAPVLCAAVSTCHATIFRRHQDSLLQRRYCSRDRAGPA